MLINLIELLNSEGMTQQKQISYEADVYHCRLGKFPILKKTMLELNLINVGKGKVDISGSMELVLSIPCDRCLKDTEVPFALKISERITAADLENPIDTSTMSFISEYELDTDKLIVNEILINWPMKVLCNQECRGICKQCGHDLNLGDCGCDTFVPDPRMAVIKDIFNANKEV